MVRARSHWPEVGFISAGKSAKEKPGRGGPGFSTAEWN